MRPQASFQAQPINRVDQALPRFITKSPITGVRHPDDPNRVRVRNGQRRGLAAVPVYVLPSSAADAS